MPLIVTYGQLSQHSNRLRLNELQAQLMQSNAHKLSLRIK